MDFRAIAVLAVVLYDYGIGGFQARLQFVARQLAPSH